MKEYVRDQDIEWTIEHFRVKLKKKIVQFDVMFEIEC